MMKCYDLLGITERATIGEIEEAYNKKSKKLEAISEINASIINKKKAELEAAKKECIAWQNKDFSEKIAARIKDVSFRLASSNRMGICIGPFTCFGSCCEWGCGSEQYETCPCKGCWLPIDLGLYTIISIPICIQIYKAVSRTRAVKAAIKEAEKEEKIRIEQERLAAVQRNQQQFVIKLRELMTNVNIKNIDSAKRYVFSKAIRENVDSDFALSEAAKYSDKVEQAYIDAVYNHKFDDAIQYIDFLRSINSYSDKYNKLYTGLNNISIFFRKESPYIMTSNYGEVNKTLLAQVESVGAVNSPQSYGCNLSALVWQVALLKPFDRYSYQIIIGQLSKYCDFGVSIDIVASMIYVETVYGREMLNKIKPSYSEMLNLLLTNGTVDSIKSIASFSAWCGNKRVEALALECLNGKGNLSYELANRYNFINGI